MTPQEVEKEFGILRDLTRRTEMLADIQALQFKKWIPTILKRSGQAIFSGKDRAVLFDIDGPGLPAEDEMRYITVCTRWLLGNDIKVGVRSSTDSWVADEGIRSPAIPHPART